MIKIFVVSIFVVLSTACSRDDSVLNVPSFKLNSSIEDSLAVCDVPLESQFDIEFIFLSDFTESERSLFIQAADRWEDVIVGDLINVEVPDNFGYRSDFLNKVILVEDDYIDDLRIYVAKSNAADQDSIMQAYVQFRRVSDLKAVIGEILTFPNSLNQPFSYKLVLHEIGHILGIGTLWSHEEINMVSCSNDGSVPFFNGWIARLVFKQVFGNRYEGPIVPLTVDSWHWPRDIFAHELMNPIVSPGSPLSSITIAALGDLGYEVNPLSADYYHAPPEIPFAGKPIANTVVCTRPEIVHELKSIE